MTKDLKCKYTKPKETTYSGVPTSEGFRLVITSTDIENGDELSSTDFDTAFLQSFKWKDDKLVHDAFLKKRQCMNGSMV